MKRGNTDLAVSIEDLFKALESTGYESPPAESSGLNIAQDKEWIMDDAEKNGITKSSRMLVLEVRTILDVIIRLVGDEGDVIEELSKQELIHFLNIAKSRLNVLSNQLGQHNSDGSSIK